METTQTQNKIADLIKNPTAIMDAVKNPGKFGLDYYNSLSNRNKQYLVFAGAAGLLIYGIILGRQNKIS